MGYPTCDSCGIDIYPVIQRVCGGCCPDCRDRIEEDKKRRAVKLNDKGEKCNV
ncbi:hypothetical protein [Bacillus thuringiensis]|uniref:hypothetical protein n=1 Tax=Bacillus thuringiensis TaxID=1428 RepID=UPI0015C50E30|nr:hypothetical protein [Bacillus thuringiensis]